MKVKITHTVRYEDVPNIVNELLNRCRFELKKSSEFKFDILRLRDTAEEISKVQSTLDLVSSQLEDCLNLCQGYANFQQQQQQNESTQQQLDELEDPGSHTPVEDLDEQNE